MAITVSDRELAILRDAAEKIPAAWGGLDTPEVGAFYSDHSYEDALVMLFWLPANSSYSIFRHGPTGWSVVCHAEWDEVQYVLAPVANADWYQHVCALLDAARAGAKTPPAPPAGQKELDFVF